MSQNLVQVVIPTQEIEEAKQSIDNLDRLFKKWKLITLTPDQRRARRGMGKKSEQFGREALIVGQANPQLIPDSLGLQDSIEDLTAYDQLLPLQTRLTAVNQKLDDSILALGSDIMDAAHGIYLLLKAFGKGEGLDELRKGLGTMFARKRRKPEETKDEE